VCGIGLYGGCKVGWWPPSEWCNRIDQFIQAEVRKSPAEADNLTYWSPYKPGSPWNHEGFQTNQHTSQDRISLAATITYYIKFTTSFQTHQSLEQKFITTQVHNKVEEANSFETTHAHLVQIQCQIMIKSHKSSRWDIWNDHTLDPSCRPSLGRDSWCSNHSTSDHLQQQWKQSPEYENVLS
jgi:hypothetical protein